jgi:ParB-like chromosome segregation protein Spo0J
MIATDLASLARPINDLHALPGNPRKGDIEAVMRSYERFGQRKPIVALRDGTVIAGNHQLEAARLLGWSEIAVVFVDDDEMTAKAYALADNRVADLGTYDPLNLAAMLDEVSLDEELLIATGYSPADVARLIGEIEPFIPEVPEFPELNPENLETDYRCPSCNYEWSGSPKPGAPLHRPE